jgi:cellulose biosynthesis protein BcsQ
MTKLIREKLAERAEEKLIELNDIDEAIRKELGTNSYYKTYKKSDLAKMPLLSKALVVKAVSEMEAAGYKFPTKKHGKTTTQAFTIQDIGAIYKHRGVKTYAKKYGKAFVIFIGNLKGGVTKTVTTVTLAHGLRAHPDLLKEDLRILVIDVDPQSSATMFLNNEKSIGEIDNTAVQAMLQKPSKENLMKNFIVKSIIGGVDLIPSSIEDAFIASDWSNIVKSQTKLNGLNEKELLLKNIIEPLEDEYDFIFVDSGPHMDPMLENSIVAADICLTPVPPATVDFHSTLKYLKRIPEIIDRIEESGATVKMKANIGFMTKIANKENHRQTHSSAKDVFGAYMLDATLNKLDGYERSGETFDTVISADPETYDGDIGALTSARNSAFILSKAVFDRIESIRKED